MDQNTDFYYNAEVWTDQPGTKFDASPHKLMMVNNATIIKVKRAFYRDCYFDGAFLLAPSVKLPLPKEGRLEVEVICRWFEHRLKTRGPLFKINAATTEVIENYTGQVWTDLNSWAGYKRDYK